MKIIEKNIEDVIPYDRNPRLNDQAVDGVAKSIQQFGFNSPILIDKDNIVIAGHTRLKAAKQIGLKTVPCVIAENLTDDQVKAYRIADNKLAEISTWNYELLLSEIESLKDSGLDLSLLDFEIVDLAEPVDHIKEGKTDPNAAPDVPVAPKSKINTLYKLGDHILLCGDSTKKEDMAKLMGSEFANLYCVDPPYNVALKGASTGLTIKNDDMSDSKFYEFLNSAFRCASSGLVPGACFYIFHSDSEAVNFRQTCAVNKLIVQETLYWVKQSFVLGHFDYHYQTESCLYGWKDGGQYNWYGERQQSNLLRYPKPARNPDHPSPKPVEMLIYLIKNSSKRGEIVLDNFGGSGSTLIACEQTGRRCRMIELDEKYCDVIRRRYAEFVAGEGCDWETLTPEIKENDDAGTEN